MLRRMGRGWDTETCLFQHPVQPYLRLLQCCFLNNLHLGQFLNFYIIQHHRLFQLGLHLSPEFSQHAKTQQQMFQLAFKTNQYPNFLRTSKLPSPTAWSNFKRATPIFQRGGMCRFWPLDEWWVFVIVLGVGGLLQVVVVLGRDDTK